MTFLEYYLKEENINIIKTISPEEALDIIQKARIGGKRAGEPLGAFPDSVDEPMAIIELPIDMIGDEEIANLKDASNPDRVMDYSKQTITTPIYAKRKRKSDGWYVMDGGHRVTAAILRGDKTIKAIVPISSLPDLKESSEIPLEIRRLKMLGWDVLTKRAKQLPKISDSEFPALNISDAVMDINSLLDMKGMYDEHRRVHYDAHRQEEMFGNYTLPEWFMLLKDISTNGLRNPIFLDVDANGDTKISEGNHRIHALKQLGYTQIPVEYSSKLKEKMSMTESPDPSNYNEILNRFNSVSEIVNSEDWDKLAFGYSSGEITNIPTKDLKIKWRQDYENAKEEIDTGSYKYKDAWDELPPIEVSLEKDKLYIEDGYHRYYYAKKHRIPEIKSEITIKSNPITALGFDSIDDLIHQWKRLKGK